MLRIIAHQENSEIVIGLESSPCIICFTFNKIISVKKTTPRKRNFYKYVSLSQK